MTLKIRRHGNQASDGGPVTDGANVYELTPMTLTEAKAFVDSHHRHHRAPQGGPGQKEKSVTLLFWNLPVLALVTLGVTRGGLRSVTS